MPLLTNLKMRSIRIIVLLVLVCCTSMTSAQHKAFQFGFSGGINLGWYATNADGYSSNGAKFGGSWGFVADVFLMEGYAFTTGFNVLFINGGMTYPSLIESQQSSEMISGTLSRDFHTRYVQLPLIFTMKTKPINEKFRVFGQVGFGLGFLINARSKDTFEPTEGTVVQTGEGNARDDFRLTRESLILGAGVEIPLYGSMFARTGIRFDNSFTNILKGYNLQDPEIKNNGRNNFIEIFVAVIF